MFLFCFSLSCVTDDGRSMKGYPSRALQFGSSLPQVVFRRAHVLFTLFVFVCVLWCPTHVVLCFCFAFLCLVWHVLPVSMDCSFWLPLWAHTGCWCIPKYKDKTQNKTHFILISIIEPYDILRKTNSYLSEWVNEWVIAVNVKCAISQLCHTMARTSYIDGMMMMFA